MAIEIDFDIAPLSEAINGMLRKISHFKRVGIGTGMSEFQTEDMNRDRPYTVRNRSKGTATTLIRPRSLYEVKRSRRAQLRIRRFAVPTKSGRRRKRPVSGLQAKTSTRPVLRQEMYKAFNERLVEMMHDSITWDTGKD